MTRILPLLLLALALLCVQPCQADLAATYNSAADLPVTANGFSASGTFSATLNFAPPTGTTLTVVKNTGPAFINGTFSNLAQGQFVMLNYGGINYRFIANYYGGSGNDLVLQWARTRTVAWGDNFNGEIGDKSTTDRLVPVDVFSTGVLAGKRVVALSVGGDHSLALCSDGTIAAWGRNDRGQLGNGMSQQGVPMAVSTAGVLSGKTVVAVAAGYLHSLALCSDGTVAAWGSNSFGQLGDNSTTDRLVPVAVNGTGVLSGKTVVAVAAGWYHSLALCSDGTMVAWGSNLLGRLGNNSTTNSPVPVAVNTDGVLSGKTVVAVAAGYAHNLVLCSDGVVAAWGGNGNGNLGNNSTTSSLIPIAVDSAGILSGKIVVAVAAGTSHSLVLCSDGMVVAWGRNDYGQLGNNSTAQSLVPVAVSMAGVLAGKMVVGVAAGEYHSLAQCSDGTLATWGPNNDGQLGDNSTTWSLVPVAVSSIPLGSGERYVSAVTGSAAAHNLALVASPSFPTVTRLAATNVTKTGATLNGTVDPDGAPATANFEYGLNNSYGSSASVTLSPNDDFGAQNVSTSLTGLTPGTIYHYRLTVSTSAHTVSTTDGVFATSTDVAANFSSASDVPVTMSVVTAAGSIVNLTLNFAPPVGTTLMVVKSTGAEFINGQFINLAQGQLVILSYGGMNYRFIANYYGGTGNDLVLQWAKTRPVAWGSNGSGQLAGDPFSIGTNSLVPVDLVSIGVLTGKTVISMVAGYGHTLALCSDGTVAAWGRNYEGQLGNGTTTNSSVPVAVNIDGALSGKTVIGVAAGDHHSLAICSDGTVVAWGENSSGKLGNNSTADSSLPVAVDSTGVLAGKMVVGVSAGNHQSLALCSDGTVAAWGSGAWGELGDDSTLNSPVPVAVNTVGVLAGKTVISVVAGSDHSMALCSDGTVAAWGSNGSGQLGNNSAAHSRVPVAVNTAGVLAGKTVVGLKAGRLHSLALCADGTVAAWGLNSWGQLGNNSTTESRVPVAVNTAGVLSGKTVAAVAAGYNHSLVYCSDGTMAAWGYGSSGQLGNNGTFSSSVPVAVSSSPLDTGESYTAVFSGPLADHNLGIIASPSPLMVNSPAVTNVTKTGAMLRGIVNPNGSPATAYFEYGLDTSYGSTASASLSPNDGIGAQNVNADLTGLLPGTIYHYRLTATNGAGIVTTADGTFATSIDVAANFNSASDVPFTTSLFSAEGATFNATLSFAPPTGTNLVVVRNTGTDFIRGKFTNLIHGQTVTLSFGGINYRFIANYYGGTGNDLVLQWAMTRTVAWGANGGGQLGDKSSTNRPVPVDVFSTGVLAGKTVISTAAGGSHSLALCSDGSIAAWGLNSSGQLGNGSTTNSLVPVAVNTAGVLSGKTVVAVAAGYSHSLALCSDGTVAAWGDNHVGKLGNNSSDDSSVPVAVNTSGVLSGKTVVAVVATDIESMALCSDGTIAIWGYFKMVPVAISPAGALSEKNVVAVAAGETHFLALCSDGTIAAWGYNSSGQLGDGSTTDSSVPVAVSTAGVLAGKAVIAVAAGYDHSLALCSDGTVAAWGSNSSGRLGNGSSSNSPVPVAVVTTGVLSGKTVIKVAAGNYFSLALCNDGTVAAWGYNSIGQLGNNSTISSNVPVALSTSSLGIGERYVGAFSGSSASHSLGFIASPFFPVVASLPPANITKTGATLIGTVDPNGNASTAYFEYGLDTSYGSSASVSLLPNDGVGTQIVSANLSGLTPSTVYHYRLTALSAVGEVITKDGTFATILDVAATYQSAFDIPVTASSVLAAGGTFSATLNFAPITGTNLTVVKNTGSAFINGALSNLAQGQEVTLSYAGIDYRFVANYYGGTGNDLVLQWAGSRPIAWGLNGSGQLGDSSTTSRFVPANVFASGVLAGRIVFTGAAGQSHSLALCSDGTVVAWGLNSSGQLGDNSTTNRLLPVDVFSTGVLAGRRVVALGAGGSHSLALCSDGTVVAWGLNSSGQLGNNNTFNWSVPVAVNVAGILAGKTVVAVSAGAAHSLALCSDGTVAAWGLNSSGQLGNSSTVNSLAPVAVNTAGVLAGKTVVAVAAGNAHSLALCSDGTVAAWGLNSSGQLGNSSTTNRTTPVAVSTTGILSGKTVAAIAAGFDHSLALCSDGTLAAWGYNFYGQLGNSSTTSRTSPFAVTTTGILSGRTVTAVAAGGNHSLAQCSDGTLAAWGRNSSGQLGNNSTTQSTSPVAVSGNPLAGGEKYAASFSGSLATHNLGLIASPPAPVVSTLAVTTLISGSVTLNATVNAASGSAAVSFDYGLDTSYGSTVSGTPAPVTGSVNTAVSAIVTNLAPNSTYHYRVRAANAGGTTNGADLTFTTPPDTTGPIGGTMALTPDSPVDAGAALTVAFANWTDPSMPLTYSVLIDDVLVSAEGATASRNITGPGVAGAHTLKGRIYDALGYVTEVTQNFTVNTAQESWRAFYFGTAQNVGDAADLADPDGDGMDNHFEYVAGLVPTSALSRFNVRVDSVAGQNAIVFSPLVAGRTYIVKFKSSLTDATWTTLTDIATNDNGSERTISDLSDGSGQRFYQVEITFP